MWRGNKWTGPPTTITFVPPTTKHQHHNKTANKWARRLENRRSIRTHKTTEARFHHLFHNDANLWRGVLDISIPSAIADSSATSSVGTETNPFLPTGRPSHKIFRLSYPTTSPNEPEQSAKWQPKSENRREMSTSLPESPRLPSSAQPSSATRDTPQSSPMTRSTSTSNRHHHHHLPCHHHTRLV